MITLHDEATRRFTRIAEPNKGTAQRRGLRILWVGPAGSPTLPRKLDPRDPFASWDWTPGARVPNHRASPSLPDSSTTDRSTRGRRWWRGLAITGAVVFVLVGVLVAYVGLQYHGLVTGIKKSHVIAAGPKSVHGDTNILVMGLDSRLDENGKPLPPNLYAALHAGDSADGGLNANVLMLLHIPGSGAKATAISIPRDDYAALAGCPDGECMGKIKQAYGLAFDQTFNRLTRQRVTGSSREQQAREAGRKAEIDTVRQFLGGVPIDHFIEVTMVSFFQISQVVQPITVCLKEDTQDSYSGAKFHTGVQQISAEQAIAFVRQRRDNTHPDLNFTDLDRSRRQQAFIASLFNQLKQADTLINPTKLSAILAVAKQNTAIDSGLDILSLASDAASLSGSKIHFYTLPIAQFGTDPLGESVNLVDLPLIQSTVHHLLYGAPALPTAPTTTASPQTRSTVNAANASGRAGAGRQLLTALAAKGYLTGQLSNNPQRLSTSLVEYPPGDQGAAQTLAAELGGLPTQPRSDLGSNTLQVIIGTNFTTPPGLGQPAAAPATPPPATAVSALGGGRSGPPPTALTDLQGGGIPCVK